MADGTQQECAKIVGMSECWCVGVLNTVIPLCSVAIASLPTRQHANNQTFQLHKNPFLDIPAHRRALLLRCARGYYGY